MHLSRKSRPDHAEREQSSSERRRARNDRAFQAQLAQSRRVVTLVLATFGVLGLVRVALAVFTAGAFHARHAYGLLIAGGLLFAAWVQHRRHRDQAT